MFQFGNRSLDLSVPRVMGILNVTPDSFSDGGRYADMDKALFQAERMVLEGAEIIDVGGESTRPGATVVSVSEELGRVIPVIEAISDRLDVVISVDTSTPQVITESASAGAGLINDVRALQRDGALSAAANTSLPVCLMHMIGESPATMQDDPRYADLVEDVELFLLDRVQKCVEAGIETTRLILDPGFGFGKTTGHNYRLLNQLGRFCSLGFPVLTGLSRKSMIGAATGIEVPEDRISGSVAGAILCVLNGAKIVRVHDVKDTVAALKVVAATLEAK